MIPDRAPGSGHDDDHVQAAELGLPGGAPPGSRDPGVIVRWVHSRPHPAGNAPGR